MIDNTSSETGASVPATRLQIGDWCLDPLAHELSRGDERRRLPKRLVRLLLALAGNPGVTVTRDALLAAAWERRMVSDEVLSRSIAELRQMLDDDARHPRYIETLPKTGYRLLAEVSEVGDAPSAVHADPIAFSSVAPPSSRPAFLASLRRRTWLASVSVLGALLLLALIVRYAPPPQPSADPTWTAAAMVFEQPFLSDPDWIRQPRFSRDGRWLVYLGESRQTGQTRIWLAAADGSAAQTIDAGQGRLSGPVLSPDATQLAVLARTDGRCEVRVLRLPAGIVQTLATCAESHGLALEWDNHGALIFTAPAEQGDGHGLVRLDRSGALHTLTRPQATQIADTQPRVAADDRIAFLRGPSGLQRVWVLQDGRERILIDSEDRVPDLAWSPDARQLLMASNLAGFPALYAVDPDSGDTHLLGGRGAATLDIAPDGRLVYERRRYDANLWLYRDQSQPRALSRSTRYDAYPALAPDGSRVAYVSNRDGSSSVWLLDLGNGTERRLDLPAADAWMRPAFSHDGSHLLLTRYADGRSTGVSQHDLRSGRTITLDSLGSDAFGAVAAADGGLLYGRKHADGMQLWLAPVDADPRAVAHANSIAEFRGGDQWIAYQRRGESGLMVQSVKSSDAPRRLLPELAPGRPAVWGLAGNVLVYIETGLDDAAWLWRVDLPDGAPEPWLPIASGNADPVIAATHDGEFVIVSRVDRVQIDLMSVAAPR